MKIKIAFIVNDLGLGGVQNLTIQFVNLLDKKKFDVTLITLLSRSESFFYLDELQKNIRYKPLSFKGFFDILAWITLYKFIRKEKYHIVFTQLFMADAIGRVTAFVAGVPVIITEIQNIIPNLPKKFIIVDRLLAKITNACISTASAVTNYAISVVGFPKEKIIEISTNAVDISRFKINVDKDKFRKELGIQNGSKIVINVGRLVSQKGQAVLLKASKIILSQRNDICFLIIGSGKLEEELRNEAKNLGVIDSVKFLGARKDIPSLLMNSDVFVFPSLWEGQGLVLFDAIFSKIPIIASETGGIPEVIENKVTGLLVKVGDHEALAKNILKIIDDREFGRSLANKAYEKFKDRTMENSIRKLEEVLENLYNNIND